MPTYDENTSRTLASLEVAGDAIAPFLASAHVVDVATWIERLPKSGMLQHLLDLTPERRARVFSKLTEVCQSELAVAMSAAELALIFDRLDPDDRADLVNFLPPARQRQLLEGLSEEERADIGRLASHEDRSVGAIMTSGYAVLAAEMIATEALAELRRQAPEAETIYRSYVLNDAGRLIGSIRLHELVMAADQTPVSAVMETDPVSVALDASRETVAQMIERYDLLAIPVVDAQGTLLGIVTHDDAADAMQAEMTEDFQKISTVLPFSQNMRQASIRLLYSRRIVWLALLVFGNLFSGAGIAYFEETILAYVSLVFFLPLLIDSSGNAGAQSATLMVRALATGDVELRDWRDLIARELFIAAALGITMAAVVFPLGVWRGGADVALVVGLTMFFVVIIGSLTGMSLPFLLSRLKLDPATASGPLVTTISDAVGVLIYFSIATLVLSL